MSSYRVLYQLHLSWIGGSIVETFDMMSEALDKAACTVKLHPECLGMIDIVLWRSGYPSQHLGFCALYHLHEWPKDAVIEALL